MAEATADAEADVAVTSAMEDAEDAAASRETAVDPISGSDRPTTTARTITERQTTTCKL